MTPRSITHRILRAALAIALLMQAAFVTPAGACGANGGCCSESSTCQDSDGCCCKTKNGQDGVRVHACCHSAEVADPEAAASSRCSAKGASNSRCFCHCSQSTPMPVAPPADGDTQIRLIPVYAYLTAAADLTPVIAVSTGRNDRQSSLLKTAPRSVQVLFCTWLT